MAYTTATTAAGNSYRSYDEVLPGSKDGIRAFVPTNLSDNATAVWLIHGFGSSHDALLGGYAAAGRALVDAGYIAICPNLGGSLWSSPKAQKFLKDSYAAAEKLLASRGVKIASNVMVGTSHGGCMAIYATGKSVIPNIKALYTVNGVYDPQTTKGSYGSQMPLHYKLVGGTAATNPANLPISAFNVPIRLVYDKTDPTVNAGANSEKLQARLIAAGKSVSERVHNSEHSTPGGTPADLVKFIGASLG